MNIKNMDLAQAGPLRQNAPEIPADMVVRRCINAHLPRYRLSQNSALVIYTLISVAVFGLLARQGNVGYMLAALPVCLCGAFPYCYLMGVFEIAPFKEEVDPKKLFAAPHHMRAMELDLPPDEYGRWRDTFHMHLHRGAAVSIQDLIDFANKLEQERINQTHLRAQQMIFDRSPKSQP
ncbi:hypothetical protein os4_35680 (plasmid) [Comamonadaceae bacterium OS-4]|nr:hypothetical protein os4_35680 [Comamonadaceae bacterium OS-4]